VKEVEAVSGKKAMMVYQIIGHPGKVQAGWQDNMARPVFGPDMIKRP
jgi:hypothetical protein